MSTWFILWMPQVSSESSQTILQFFCLADSILHVKWFFFSNFACVFCFLGKFVEFEYNFGWKHREVTLFLVLFAKKVSKSFRQIDPCWRSGWCLHTSAWWLQMLKLTNSDYLRNANWPVNHAPYHYNRTLLFLSTLQGLFLFFIVFFFKIWWFCVFWKQF